jgi:small ligand-binding sensory domain FIST
VSSPADVRTARFGDGLSVDPILTDAAESAVTQAVTPLDGQRPDLVAVFVCGAAPEADEAAGMRAMELAGAHTTVGCSAGGVIGNRRGVENEPAVSVFAACLPGIRCTPFHLELLHTADGVAVAGMPDRGEDDRVAMLLTDPATFPIAAFLQRANDDYADLPFTGGVASGHGYSGNARLFLNGETVPAGAVGVMLGGDVTVRPVVSQGCRPFGPPMVVTKAEGNVLLELAGTPALTKLEEVVAALDPQERQTIAQGLNIGVVMDEYAMEHERGDFLIRPVMGADRDQNAIAIGDMVDVGRTVRFQVRDAAAADDDFAETFSRFRSENGPAGGALLFSCNGRGRAMFPSADHDVLAVRDGLGATGVAGFFAAGEIGPVAGRNHLHGFTASILAFGANAS